MKKLNIKTESSHQSKDKSKWFALGREVSYAFPGGEGIGLKPTDKQMKDVANKLGIKIKDAWLAWNSYTWGNEPEKSYPYPNIPTTLK